MFNGHLLEVTRWGMRVLDISPPTAPLTDFQFEVTTDGSIAHEGTHVYILHVLGGLQILNISNPRLPVLSSLLTWQGAPLDLVVSGNRGFVADQQLGLLEIDWTDPTQPAIVETIPSAIGSIALVIDEEYAYVLAPEMLRIYDLSAGLNLLGSVALSNISRALSVRQGIAYVSDDDGLSLYDLSVPSLPEVLGHLVLPGVNLNSSSRSDTLFLGKGEAGMQVVDVIDPGAPSARGIFNSPGYASASIPRQDLLYLANHNNCGVEILDIADPDLPTRAGCFQLGGLIALTDTGTDLVGLFQHQSPNLAGMQVRVLAPTCYEVDLETYNTMQSQWPAAGDVRDLLSLFGPCQ